MKRYWRELSVTLTLLVFAASSDGEEYAVEGPRHVVIPDLPTERQLGIGHISAARFGEFDLPRQDSGPDPITGFGPPLSSPPIGEVVPCGYEDGSHPAVVCSPVWAHRSGLFAEVMALRARGVEMAYAVPVNGAIVPPPAVPVQVGPTAVADPDVSAGFRVGFTYAFDDCSSVSLNYTRFQSSSTDVVGTTAPLVLRSQVFHPGSANAGSDFLDAFANSDVRFDLVDVDYRSVWVADDLWAVNYLVGARYAGLKQDFSGSYSGTGTTDTLVSNIDFEGGGVRLGLDGMRFARNSGFLVYGKTSASFVAGELRGRYTQSSDVDPIIVDTTWRAGRVLSILEMELGAGWQSRDGHWRFTCGYTMASWGNALPQNQWIQAVQTNSFSGLSNSMNPITFDGLTTRLEYRW
jgi:hypothetical protein